MNTVQITARISTEAHDILMREARLRVEHKKSRLPIGEILDTLILYSEARNDWKDIADRLELERELRREHRLFKDLARKTHKKASKAASFFCKLLVFNNLNFTKRTPLR
jgi:hypothetical protein